MATIKIPASICALIEADYDADAVDAQSLKNIRKGVKTMIEAAISDTLSPSDLPASTEAGQSMNITFAGAYDRAIRALAKAKGVREGDAALMFLYAALARGDAATLTQKDEPSFLDRYTQALGLGRRAQQSVFAQYLLDSLQGTGIGMVEAATGVGKTLGIVAACSELTQQAAFSRAVVAVPSIQLIRQFAAQHRALESAGIQAMPRGRCVMGRNEFVSAQDVIQILNSGTELIDGAPVRQWLEDDAPGVGKDAAFELPYLASSLLQVSPQFPVDAARLRTDTSPLDPGAQAYAGQFSSEREEGSSTGEIIYCTHAMLAIDVRKRRLWARRSQEGLAVRDNLWAQHASDEPLNPKEKRKQMGSAIEEEIKALASIALDQDVGILPPWQHLVIDEAHVFESNLANILATNISIGSVLRSLTDLANKSLLPKAALKQAQQAVNLIRSFAGSDEYDLSSTSAPVRQIYSALCSLYEATGRIKSEAKKDPAYPALQLQTRAIDLAIKVAVTPYGQRAIFRYSPVRAYPQLSIGRQSVASELKFMWQSARSAAAVSATLYLRKLEKDSAAYSASVLGVPNDRLIEFPVIRPAWTYKPVQAVWTPASEKIGGRFWLRPPSRGDRLSAQEMIQAEDQWISELAKSLQSIYHSAQGGVLVLMTSYALSEKLSLALDPAIQNKIVASNRHSLTEQMGHFVHQQLAAQSQGSRALWIAVGGAWTGVDINGAHHGIDDPAQDNLLTDLVIPRLPFGLNKSMTHKTRTESVSSVPWELLDAAMRFKQGLGRLVRREGLAHNRRIFVLDGRLADPAFDNYLAHFKRILSAYSIKSLQRPAG